MTQNPRELFSRIAEIAQEEERMDAMTPDGSTEREREPETPTALRFMGETMARQVELGIVIEQAHQSEVRAHRNTKMRLGRCEADRERVMKANREVNAKLDQVRDAIAGDVFGHTAPPDGDVLAEARELFARNHNLERDLLEAKALLESATAQNANWEAERAKWQERVAMVLGLAERPEQTPDNPWGLPEPELGQEYDRRPTLPSEE